MCGSDRRRDGIKRTEELRHHRSERMHTLIALSYK